MKIKCKFKGEGKVWAAVLDNQVVGVRYVKRFPFVWESMPLWLAAFMEEATGTNPPGLPTFTEPPDLKRAEAAALACPDCPHHKLRRYGHTDLHDRACALILEHNGKLYVEHEQRCIAELSKLGDVVLGEIVKGEFYRD